jgi:small GTP-binding protein
MEQVQKVMLLGDIGVGKTSLVRRLVLNRFEHDYKATIGVDVYTHSLVLRKMEGGELRIKLLIWDIDGDFGESIFSQVYIKGASSALIIGDCTRTSTVSSMATLAESFADQFPGRPMVLVLNKTDLVSEADVSALARPLEYLHQPIITSSAKNGGNVAVAFQTVAESAYEREL